MTIISSRNFAGARRSSMITRRLTRPGARGFRRVVFGLATSGLLLLLGTVLVARPLTHTARVYEPFAIPDITGTYDGPEVRTSFCADGTMTFTIPGTLIIPSQQGQSFSGSLDDGEIILNGNLDASGGLTGTYSLEVPTVTGSGTFTGQASGNQLQLNLAGTFSSVGGTCNQTYVLTAMRSASPGPMADLSISGSASPSPVVSGARVTYALM